MSAFAPETETRTPGPNQNQLSQNQLSPAQLSRAAALPVANIGDAMERLNVVDGAIHPIWPGARLAGPAFTVLTAGGDNKAIHEALTQIQPGHVLVINGQGAPHRALIGELIAGRAMLKGVLGMLIDGAVRDAAGLAELGFPVFARSTTPAGPYRNGPGVLQVPVAIGGVVVQPGDLIVADEDGAAVVSLASISEVLERAEQKHTAELAEHASLVEAISLRRAEQDEQ